MIFYEDYLKGNFVLKQILGGIFVTIAMVGLDQDLMQKNLSCANIGEAQKNMFTFTGIFVIINIFIVYNRIYVSCQIFFWVFIMLGKGSKLPKSLRLHNISTRSLF